MLSSQLYILLFRSLGLKTWILNIRYFNIKDTSHSCGLRCSFRLHRSFKSEIGHFLHLRPRISEMSVWSWVLFCPQFTVPNNMDTLYWCKIFKVPPLPRKHHMIGVSNTRVEQLCHLPTPAQKKKATSYEKEENQNQIVVKKQNLWCFHFIFISPLLPSPNYDIVLLSVGMHSLTLQYTRTSIQCLSTHNFLHMDVIISVRTSAAAWQRTLRAPYATPRMRGTTSFGVHRSDVREIRGAPWRSLLLLRYASGMGPLHDHYCSVGSRLSR